MATVGGVSSGNSVSSLYGNRNVISGLASGMDTESMIENAVSGIKNRITTLGKKRTSWEWKQAAYQGIIDKMSEFTTKYTSYTSTTNLFSSAFFNKAVSTTTSGSNASKVSATGKSTSEVYINAVKALATAGRGTAVGGALTQPTTGKPTITAGKSVNLSGTTDVSKMQGSLTLKYGNKSVSIDFDETETFASTAEFVGAIKEKLSKQKIVLSSGDMVSADTRISVNLDDATGEISFKDKSTAGNSVTVSDVTGKLKETLKLDSADLADSPTSITVAPNTALTDEKLTGEYLSGKTMTFNLNGKSKKITLPEPEYITDTKIDAKKYMEKVQASLDNAFGVGAIKASNLKADTNGNPLDPTEPGDLQLQFVTKEKGSTLTISGDAGITLELGSNATSYLNMGTTLDKVLVGAFDNLGDNARIKAEGKPDQFTKTDNPDIFLDSKGLRVKKGEDGEYYRLEKGSDTDFLKGREMKINGVVIGTYTKETAIDTVISNINNNTEAGANVSYSNTTGQFVFTTKETGDGNSITLDEGLAKKLFGSFQLMGMDGKPVVDGDGKPVGGGKVEGSDAVFDVTINGKPMTMTRSNNTFDLDGLSVTLKEKFYSTSYDTNPPNGPLPPGVTASGDKVGFTTKPDTDKVFDAVKTMVEDYNAMMKEIKGQYTTMAPRKSGSRYETYEPLSDADKTGMSEEAIKNYEDKAKQGILFGDSDLSSLYGKMRDVFNPGGSDGNFLRSIGIDSEYSTADGTTIKLDEEKFRAAMEKNPDGVKDAFTKTKENGAATNGIMQSMKTQLDNYAATTGATKGLLVEKAGSKYAPTSLLKNTIKDATDAIDKEIERWETRLSDQVDRYTRKFSQLEQLISQMNNQSSSLTSMMGG